MCLQLTTFVDLLYVFCLFSHHQAPVLEYQATSRYVYLPPLLNQTWVYFWNDTAVGPGGVNVSVPTPIGEFPLFYRRELPQPAMFAAQTRYCSSRQDLVMCLAEQCYQDNSPQTNPAYQALYNEGSGWWADGPVLLDGQLYELQPLTLWFSFQHNKNFVSISNPPSPYKAPPDSSYEPSGGAVVFNDGYVLVNQAPGSVPLQVWYSKTRDAYITIASTESLNWAKANNYTFAYNSGYIMPISL